MFLSLSLFVAVVSVCCSEDAPEQKIAVQKRPVYNLTESVKGMEASAVKVAEGSTRNKHEFTVRRLPCGKPDTVSNFMGMGGFGW